MKKNYYNDIGIWYVASTVNNLQTIPTIPICLVVRVVRRGYNDWAGRMAAAKVLTDFENLPHDVKDKLAELDLELSEG